MLMRLVSVLVFSLFFFSSFAQVDPHKLDSLSRSIDSTAKAYKAWQDSFSKVQDSIYQTSITATSDSVKSTKLSAEKKEAERRKEALIRIGIGVFLFLLFVVLLLIRKRKMQP